MRIYELHRWASNNDVDKETVACEVIYKFAVNPGDMAIDVPELPKLPPINTLVKTPNNSDDDGKERGKLLRRLNNTFGGRGKDDSQNVNGGIGELKLTSSPNGNVCDGMTNEVQNKNSNLNGETIGADDMGRKDGGDTKQRDEAETNKILDEFQKVSVCEFE